MTDDLSFLLLFGFCLLLFIGLFTVVRDLASRQLFRSLAESADGEERFVSAEVRTADGAHRSGGYGH